MKNCPGMQGRSNKLQDSFCFCGIMKRLVKQELLFWVDILPDDISTPHMETLPVMRMHGTMRVRIYGQTYMRSNHYTNSI